MRDEPLYSEALAAAECKQALEIVGGHPLDFGEVADVGDLLLGQADAGCNLCVAHAQGGALGFDGVEV